MLRIRGSRIPCFRSDAPSSPRLCLAETCSNGRPNVLFQYRLVSVSLAFGFVSSDETLRCGPLVEEAASFAMPFRVLLLVVAAVESLNRPPASVL